MKRERLLTLFLIALLLGLTLLVEASLLSVMKAWEGGGNPLPTLSRTMKTAKVIGLTALAALILLTFLTLRDIRKGRGAPMVTLDPFYRMLESFQERERNLLKEKAAEKRRTEEALVLYRALFDTPSLAILLVDRFGRLLRWNPLGAKLFGDGSDPLPLTSVSSQRGLFPLLKEAVDEFFSWTQPFAEREVEREGRVLSLYLIRVEEEKAFLMAVDITELRKTQRELALKSRQEQLGQMASYLSHELKNSLGVVLGSLERVKLPQEKGVSRALGESKRMLLLVERYLELSRSSPVRWERIPLSEVLEEAARDEGIPLENRTEGRSVWGDRVLLLSVWSNLFRNSREAGAKRVTVSVEREERELLLRVEDDGPGIAPAYREKIFLPFFSTKGENTGMGLALVSKLLSDQGGWIELLESSSGALFSIGLPLSPGNGEREGSV
ncbi:MAG TPA: ATP-binding protein [Candidatus Aminicenantes bacterium]|nr:ATP-binding protein [Candidatus Aminicenantes bacterium]HPT00135.1 ATP-binding protein [Candidatus Aminicenantes bacterium]